MSNYLILGSEGVVGSALCNYLDELNISYTRFDKLISNDQDLTNLENTTYLEECIKKTDLVFFLAFDVGGSKYLTNDNITGTSIKTPTTVTNDAPDSNPNSAIATATASSKKLLAPIIAEGETMLCGSFATLPAFHVIKNIKYVWIVNGTAIRRIWNGLLIILSPWNAKSRTSVVKSAIIENVEAIINYDPRVVVDNVIVDTYESGIQIECTLIYLNYSIAEAMTLQFDRDAGLLA